MIISIASGKGGTGKTTVSMNLAVSLETQVNLLDVDVEEPNCHIFIQNAAYIETDVHAIVPDIDRAKCTLCGKCSDICQFNAIASLSHKVLIFEELCHSCGGCMLFCPEKAISEKDKRIGKIFSTHIKNLNFIYGQLEIGYPMSPPLISTVKENILKEAINIIDCPPGVSCPAIEGVKGSDYCILVTDPTPFAMHDLKLSVEALRYLNIPFGIFLNRCDIGDDRIYDYCKSEYIEILASMPNNLELARIYSRGEILVEELPEYKLLFQDLFNNIKDKING